MLENAYQQLEAAYTMASSNYSNEYGDPWAEAYEKIFCEPVSGTIFATCREHGVVLEYYDPDTTYEEDVRAFYEAAMGVKAKIISTVKATPVSDAHTLVTDDGIFRCTRCHGSFRPQLPISLEKLASASEAFIKLHKDCVGNG